MLFKGLVVGKLVKKVKLLEDKLKGRKRKFVMTDSDKERIAEQRFFDWTGIMGQVHANQWLTADLLGSDVNEDNFAKRMVALIAKRRREFAAQRFQDKRNKPMTYAQQKAYLQTFVKNQSSTIYTTGWTLKHVKSFSDDQLRTTGVDNIRTSDVPVIHKQPIWGNPLSEMYREDVEVPSQHALQLDITGSTPKSLVLEDAIRDKKLTGGSLLFYGEILSTVSWNSIVEYPLSVNLMIGCLIQLEFVKTLWYELTLQFVDCLSQETISDSRLVVNGFYLLENLGFCPCLDADFHVAVKVYEGCFWSRFQDVAVQSSVPAGRYVVPTGKDNVIVSAGRTKVIPAVLYNLNRLEDLSRDGPTEVLSEDGNPARANVKQALGLHKDRDADASFHFHNSDKYYHDPEECEYAGLKVTTSHEVDLEPDEWIKDSGCYKAYNGEHVDNLGFNLLSIGQICDNKCRVTFSEHDSEITKDGKVIGRGIRKKGLYLIKLGNKTMDQICLAMIDENSTLWHRRLGHANMRLIQSLASKELV
ncbi:retrovirus-related pol polyprotein from transposon TNT 1-94 [Tanacetum coccineum]